MSRFLLSKQFAAIATVLFVAMWIVLTLLLGDFGVVDLICWVVVYLVGLTWVQFLVEQAANEIENRRTRAEKSASGETWNPLDPSSVLYTMLVTLAATVVFTALAGFVLIPAIAEGEEPSVTAKAIAIVSGSLSLASLAMAISQSRRLRQSLATLVAFTILFGLAYILVHWQSEHNRNASNEYDLPPGGGTDSIKAQSVKVQKVIRKRYVVNPYSNFIFAAPPPLDKIDVKLTEATSNQYKAGQGGGGLGKGPGKGGGFGSGTGIGKYEFVRLRHGDRAWNKNLGVGGDYNLLAELKSREPLVTIAKESGSIDITGVANMSPKKPLPLLYICGAAGFQPSAADKKILKEYLNDRHGMILGDNLGGTGFHNGFVSAMNEITGVTPVPIPRDDRIHQRPYELPQLPIVVAHGGTVPLGWKVDGRWVAYYHPGALSDAWRDDHSGIKKDVYELCYQLGINILYYAYSEQDSWRRGQ